MSPYENDFAEREQEALSSITRRLLILPPLQAAADTPFSAFTEKEQHVLQLLSSQLRADVSQLLNTPAGRTKLLSEIASILTRPILTGDRGKETASRLGSRGDLPPDRYEVNFDDNFESFEKLGVRKRQVVDVIHHPDAVQHLFPEPSEFRQFPLLSLLAKRFEPRRGTAFVMLVQATRSGSRLDVGAVWRASEHLVVRTSEHDLLALLKEFVSEFGVRIKVPEREPTKFIYYDAIPRASFGSSMPIPALLDLQEHREYEASFTMRVSSTDIVEIAIAYAIDVTAYRQSLVNA